MSIGIRRNVSDNHPDSSVHPVPGAGVAVSAMTFYGAVPGRAFAAARRGFRSQVGRQTMTHVAAQGVSAGLGFAVWVLLARQLGVAGFGVYSFAVAYFAFSSVFFDFGLSVATKRLIATHDAAEQRRILGTSALAALGLGSVYAVITAAAGAIIWQTMSPEAGTALLIAAPFAVAFPLMELGLAASQGANRIGVLSSALVLPRGLLLAVVAALSVTSGVTPTAAAVAYPATLLASAVLILLLLRPSFLRMRERVAELRTEVREFGRDVYAGRMVDGLTNGFDRMIISAAHGVIPTGFYSIAATMAQPIGMFSRGVSASSYRTLVEVAGIPRSLLLWNALWCLGGGTVLVLLFEVVFPLLFPDAYSASLALLPLVAVGTALAGLNEPFHAFLSARRHGRALRRMSIVTSGTNVALNLVLIPWLGAIGAALALTVSSALNLGMNLHTYRRIRA